MKKIILGILPFASMFFIISFIDKAVPSDMLREHRATVQNGLLTIPQHSDRDIFNIQGLWHSTPEQFYYFRNSAQPKYAPFPGKLNETALQSNYGYTSYGLRIVGLDPDKIYALRVGHILSSANININGVESAAQGQPGISLSTEVPGKASSIAIFRPLRNGTADVIINVSNFHNRYGGTGKAILLGSAEVLSELFIFDLIFYNLACSILLVFSSFFILLYLFNRKEMPSIIWFAMTTLTISIRIAVFDPHILSYIWPTIPWKLYFILRYSTMTLSVLFFTIFIKKILNTGLNIIYYAIIVIGSIFILATGILPTHVTSTYLHIQQGLVFIGGLYNILVIIHALIRKTKYAIWIGLTTAILMAFAVHDILVSQWIISGQLLLQRGAVVAILILVIMSLDSYASSILTIAQLVEERTHIQESLRRFFPKQLSSFLHKDNITDIKSGDCSEFPVAVLFMDIRSFTAMAEELDPESVFTLLNTYFALVAPIIRQHGGVIMKYMGDGFAALFSESADSAVVCSIEIQRILKEKNIHIANFPPISAGIGIDSGEALFGVVGNNTRLDSIVISKTYYTAEQLQHITKKYVCSVIISEKIYTMLEDPSQYRIRHLPPISAANRGMANNNLFEVFDSDDSTTRSKKDDSVIYIETAFKGIYEKDYLKAKNAISKALDLYPDDVVAQYYKKFLLRVSAE